MSAKAKGFHVKGIDILGHTNPSQSKVTCKAGWLDLMSLSLIVYIEKMQ